MAIEQALTVLNWHENLSKDEVPPEYLWEDVEGLEMWWATVESKRSDGQPTVGGAGDSSEADPGSRMAENDLATRLKQG